MPGFTAPKTKRMTCLTRAKPSVPPACLMTGPGPGPGPGQNGGAAWAQFINDVGCQVGVESCLVGQWAMIQSQGPNLTLRCCLTHNSSTREASQNSCMHCIFTLLRPTRQVLIITTRGISKSYRRNIQIGLRKMANVADHFDGTLIFFFLLSNILVSAVVRALRQRSARSRKQKTTTQKSPLKS